MRVLCYGNCGNINLRFADFLRKQGIDATLYLPHAALNPKSHPEWANDKFKDGYPEWIKVVERKLINSMVPEKEIRAVQSEYDIIFTTGLHVISALALRKPVVFLPVGSDLSKAPFGLMELDDIILKVFQKRLCKLSHVITHVQTAHAAAIKLNIKNIYNIAFPVDIDEIEENIDDAFYKAKRDEYVGCEHVFFLPARKNISENHPAYKGLEKFLYALQRVVREHPGVDCRCISIAQGDEKEKFESLVHKLGLDSFFDYLPLLSLPKLHAIMKIKDIIVVDRFNNDDRGCLGGVSREALSLGALLLTCNDKSTSWFRMIHGEGCPLFSAYTENEIYTQLKKIISLDAHEKDLLRNNAIKWSRNNLHYKNIMHKYVDIFSKIISDYSH